MFSVIDNVAKEVVCGSLKIPTGFALTQKFLKV